jgi:hypothetical protein
VLERSEPLRPHEAKPLARQILEDGIFTVSPHARDECQKDRLTDVDLVNVIRAGVYEEAEFENSSWRYRIRTARMLVVIRFESETELEVVTAWRNRT